MNAKQKRQIKSVVMDKVGFVPVTFDGNVVAVKIKKFRSAGARERLIERIQNAFPGCQIVDSHLQSGSRLDTITVKFVVEPAS